MHGAAALGCAFAVALSLAALPLPVLAHTNDIHEQPGTSTPSAEPSPTGSPTGTGPSPDTFTPTASPITSGASGTTSAGTGRDGGGFGSWVLLAVLTVLASGALARRDR